MSKLPVNTEIEFDWVGTFNSDKFSESYVQQLCAKAIEDENGASADCIFAVEYTDIEIEGYVLAEYDGENVVITIDSLSEMYPENELHLVSMSEIKTEKECR